MKLVTVFTLGVALALTAGAAQAQGQGGQGGQGRPGGFGGRGPGGPGGFFGGPGGGGGVGFLLQMPEVQAELKIDATQKELLEQLNMENRDKMRQLFQQGGFGRPGQGGAPDPAAREAMQKKMAAMQAEQTKAIGEVLDAKQMARLKQLSIQRDGTRALSRPEVQDQLKLSPDQRQKVTAAFDGERQAMQAMFESFRPQNGQQPEPPSEEQRAEFGKKMQAARATAEANALAVLTDAQKSQFKALQGAPFKFPEGGFGFGGPGGRGPGGGRPGGQRQNNQ